MDNIKKYHLELKHLKAQPLKEELVKHLSKPDEIRSIYQKDRDRIMYEKSFRRLAGKTQVFIAGHDDYVRTRLTHTLEVSQIARTISTYIGLDVDLTEAIALGHDIGHAPFGHVGERVINHFSNGCYNYKNSLNRDNIYVKKNYMGFKHNWQSIRIAESLARHKGEYGLNLSSQTLYGILHHTSLGYKDCTYHCNATCLYKENKKTINSVDKKLYLDFYLSKYKKVTNYNFFTIESIVVSVADEIAQRHHDIEDGLRSDIFTVDELLNGIEELLEENEINDIKKCNNASCGTNSIHDSITYISSMIVNSYVSSFIEAICNYFKKYTYNSLEELIKTGTETVDSINSYFDFNNLFHEQSLKLFMKHRILNCHVAQVMDGRAEFLLRRLFKAFISNPQQLPDNTLLAFKRNIDLEYKNSSQHNNKSIEKIENYKEIGHLRVNLDKFLNGIDNEAVDGVFYDFTKNRAILLRTICDYVSGMTDRRATSEYQRLYGIEKDIREL